MAFYRAAVRVAGDTPQYTPRSSAHSVVERNAAAVQQRLIDGLRASGHEPASASPRFAASVEISLGKREVYYQGPTRYYFPGLPQRQFYPREEFGWAPAIESATAAITAELRKLLAEGGHFSPYLQSSSNQPVTNERSLLDSPDWSACYLMQNGTITAAGTRCPQTLAALDAVPMPRIPDRSRRLDRARGMERQRRGADRAAVRDLAPGTRSARTRGSLGPPYTEQAVRGMTMIKPAWRAGSVH